MLARGKGSQLAFCSPTTEDGQKVELLESESFNKDQMTKVANTVPPKPLQLWLWSGSLVCGTDWPGAHHRPGGKKAANKITHSQKEVSIFISWLNSECVNCIRENRGCLDLEDLRWNGSIWADAHVFVYNGVWQVMTKGIGHRTNTATVKQTTTTEKQAPSPCKQIQFLILQILVKHLLEVPLTFQMRAYKALDTGSLDNSDSDHDNSNTFHPLGTHYAPHIHLYLYLERRKIKCTNAVKWWQLFHLSICPSVQKNSRKCIVKG